MFLSASKLKVGDTFEQDLVKNLTRTQIVQYAGASGDYNPLHTDEPYATKVAGYPTVFAPGLLVMAMTGKILTNFVGDGRVTRFGSRFTLQVWPGDDLKSKCTVTEIKKDGEQLYVELDVETVNQEGKAVLKGYATARIEP